MPNEISQQKNWKLPMINRNSTFASSCLFPVASSRFLNVTVTPHGSELTRFATEYLKNDEKFYNLLCKCYSVSVTETPCPVSVSQTKTNSKNTECVARWATDGGIELVLMSDDALIKNQV